MQRPQANGRNMTFFGANLSALLEGTLAEAIQGQGANAFENFPVSFGHVHRLPLKRWLLRDKRIGKKQRVVSFR